MLRTFKTSSLIVSNVKNGIKFPKKLKGTIVEKWADYWKNLFTDYKQMIKDLRSDAQDNPQKALKWTAGLTTIYLLARNNPNEIDFKDDLRRCTNEIIMISDTCRNPKSAEHLRYLQICYNESVIHYTNLGIASIMYVSDFSDSCSSYRTQCTYLKPSYFDFPSRIVDFGIMGKWWNIYSKIADYDVNA